MRRFSFPLVFGLLLVTGCMQTLPSPQADVTPTTVAQPEPTATPTQTPPPPTPTPEPPANPNPVEVVKGNPALPMVALTFDCGAGAGPLPSILQALRAGNSRVTFFVTGVFGEKFPDLVRQIAADGHEVSNHTYSHPSLTELGNAGILEELEGGDRVLRPLTGKSTRPWMRMPFGARTPDVLETVHRAGYTSIYWTMDSGDWQADATAASVLNRAGSAKNGDIVVQHCGAQQSAEALPGILRSLGSRGLRAVTISELLGRPRAAATVGPAKVSTQSRR